MKKYLLAISFMIVSSGSLHSEEYRAIFWNMESGKSNDSFVADQMVQKGKIDFWGLSEVRDQSALDTFEQKLENAFPGIDYITKLSEEGDGDRLAILYRSDRLTAVDYSGNATVDDIGNNFFEVDSINVGDTIRPGLGIQLQNESGQMMIAMVHHWKCCGGRRNINRRKQQAIQLNAFAISTPGIPIVSGGDYNIALNNGGMQRSPFNELLQIWEFKSPLKEDGSSQLAVGTHKGGSMLDAVFVTNKIPGWESEVTVLKREGNEQATSIGSFSDNNSETDHRPLLMVINSDADDHLESLRDAVADLEAALKRTKAELERLEAINSSPGSN